MAGTSDRATMDPLGSLGCLYLSMAVLLTAIFF